jgi:Zn-dependent protease with chaperone function
MALNSLTQLVAMSFGYLILSVIVDYARGLKGPPLKTISEPILKRVREVLDADGLARSSLSPERFEFNGTDLAMGAHVKGVIRPHLVISGGLLVGLIRRDARANAIVCHEIAHIEHYDRLLPGIIGLTAIEIVGAPIIAVVRQTKVNHLQNSELLTLLAIVFAYKLLVSGGILSILSRRRELYADARALALTKDHETYIEILRLARFSHITE